MEPPILYWERSAGLRGGLIHRKILGAKDEDIRAVPQHQEAAFLNGICRTASIYICSNTCRKALVVQPGCRAQSRSGPPHSGHMVSAWSAASSRLGAVLAYPNNWHTVSHFHKHLRVFFHETTSFGEVLKGGYMSWRRNMADWTGRSRNYTIASSRVECPFRSAPA